MSNLTDKICDAYEVLNNPHAHTSDEFYQAQGQLKEAAFTLANQIEQLVEELYSEGIQEVQVGYKNFHDSGWYDAHISISYRIEQILNTQP